MTKACFFDDQIANRLQPLTLTRPAADLRLGIYTLAEKWAYELDLSETGFLTEAYLAPLFPSNLKNQNTSCLLINGRCLPNPSLIENIKTLKLHQGLIQDNNLIAALVPENVAVRLQSGFEVRSIQGLELKSCKNAMLLQRSWDIFLNNGQAMQFDMERIKKNNDFDNSSSPDTVTKGQENIYIHKSAEIEPGVVLIAEDGPIYIGANARIMAGSVLRGPTAICNKAIVKMGAKIYGHTTIGPVCKVGGEVNNCVFHSYSNKGHEGFTGNSVFGQWCNLGADTNTSNLKNNYSLITMNDFAGRKPVPTQQQFIGTIMGDHSKTAINTMLNTGTICGVSSNIFSNGFPPKYIPSFRWLGNTSEIYQFDKAVETMKRVMKRRDIEISDKYIAMMQTIFENSTD